MLDKLKSAVGVQRREVWPFASALGLTLGYLAFASAQQKLIGLVLLILAAVSASRLPAATRKYLLALVAAVSVLAATPLRTVPTLRYFCVVMGMMAGAVLIVYLVSRYFEKEQLVHFRFDWRRHWRSWEIGYLLLTAATVYFLMPFYFKETGAIHAWYFRRDLGEILAVFGSTMVIGIWEEFFFTATVLGVLRKYLPFFWANTLQAVLFAGFLYQIGFRYWAPPFLFAYAWAQGWVFTKTRSLLFVLVVHICVDLLVCLVLLHAYYPDMVRIFVTG